MRLMNMSQDHDTIIRNQEVMIAENRTMIENQEKKLDEHAGMLRTLTDNMVTLTETMGTLAENLEELRRDSRHTQRLWIRLAQKNGWLDDDDLWDERDS